MSSVAWAVPPGREIPTPTAAGAPLSRTVALSARAMVMRRRLFDGVAGNVWAVMVACSWRGPDGTAVTARFGRGLQDVGTGVGGGSTVVGVGVGVRVGGASVMVNGALVAEASPG